MIIGLANECDVALTQQVGTYDTVLSTGRIDQDVSGGVEGRLGWIMPNCCNAIDVTYWGIYPDNQSASILASNYAGGIRRRWARTSTRRGTTTAPPTRACILDVLHRRHQECRSRTRFTMEGELPRQHLRLGVVPDGSACGDCNG